MAGRSWLGIVGNNDAKHAVDRSFHLDCPHCGAHSNITAVSIPRYEQIARYSLEFVIMGFRCDACNRPIALRFKTLIDQGNQRVLLSEEYEEIERPMETFEYQHLPGPVATDFKEALTCYSHLCYNATAAMCRRTIQSVATDLGAQGTDKVSRQLLEVKEAAEIGDDEYAALKQSMLDGHDGAHPHLPAVTAERAAVLVEMMKDVLYQLYIRKARVQRAVQLRQEAIAEKRGVKE